MDAVTVFMVVVLGLVLVLMYLVAYLGMQVSHLRRQARLQDEVIHTIDHKHTQQFLFLRSEIQSATDPSLLANAVAHRMEKTFVVAPKPIREDREA